ncbi:hypothetical protein [Achromobacter aegrifaciens]|nr:hypothetical protein DAI43_31010 [Achromobacter xylosoxidans]
MCRWFDSAPGHQKIQALSPAKAGLFALVCRDGQFCAQFPTSIDDVQHIFQVMAVHEVAAPSAGESSKFGDKLTLAGAPGAQGIQQREQAVQRRVR